MPAITTAHRQHPQRASCDGQRPFAVQGAGRHSILCHVPDGTGGGTGSNEMDPPLCGLAFMSHNLTFKGV
jgi:hypothetical protein